MRAAAGDHRRRVRTGQGRRQEDLLLERERPQDLRRRPAGRGRGRRAHRDQRQERHRRAHGRPRTDRRGARRRRQRRRSRRRRAAEVEAATKRRDLAMVESYATEDDLRRAYGERITLVEESLKTSRLGIVNLRQSLLSLLRQAADLELQSQPVRKPLSDNIVRQHGDLLRQQAILEQQLDDRASLGSDLEQALERYRALKGRPGQEPWLKGAWASAHRALRPPSACFPGRDHVACDSVVRLARATDGNPATSPSTASGGARSGAPNGCRCRSSRRKPLRRRCAAALRGCQRHARFGGAQFPVETELAREQRATCEVVAVAEQGHAAMLRGIAAAARAHCAGSAGCRAIALPAAVARRRPRPRASSARRAISASLGSPSAPAAQQHHPPRRASLATTSRRDPGGAAKSASIRPCGACLPNSSSDSPRSGSLGAARATRSTWRK